MDFLDAFGTERVRVLLAGMVMSSLPMVLIVITIQGHLVRGMAAGAVKG